MGQRSQIYFRVNQMDGKYALVARYFQWNYGTRMVSRARGLIEWLESNKDFPTMFYKGSETLTKAERIIDINFDYHDVVLSQDIIKEYEEGYYDESSEMFLRQANNDGQLLVDMIIDWEHKDKKGDYKVTLKYAFLDWNSKLIGNGEDYMQWNEDYGDKEDSTPWRENEHIQKEIKYTERNIRYIDKHATLMTPEEVSEYINHDYIKDMGLVVKREEETA